MKEKIKRYFPDVLILIGIYLLAVEFSPCVGGRLFCDPNWKVIWGIMMIALALDVVIRRYFSKRNSD